MTSSAPESPRHSQDVEAEIVVEVFALTDVGHTRDHNEDTYLVADLESAQPVEFQADAMQKLRPGPHGALFLVADGMGGAASGELASSLASQTVLDMLRSEWTSKASLHPEVFAAALRDATTAANDRIHRHAKENPEHRGMGTTATIVGLLRDHLYLAQVGDSRAYLVRNSKAIQLTKDQSLMQRLVEAGELTEEEAELSERRNIILQALGPEAQISIDLTHQQLRRGDTLILCSDGLSGLVRADEIARIASESPSVDVLCHRLVDRANEAGGTDNITVIVARLNGRGLDDTRADDQVGHKAFPLEGTLSDDTLGISSMTGTEFKSDPTPPFGYPMPGRDDIALVDTQEMEVAPPASEPVVEARKERALPVMWLLGAAAIAAAAFTIWRFFFAGREGAP